MGEARQEIKQLLMLVFVTYAVFMALSWINRSKK